jgi:hypothetical protein
LQYNKDRRFARHGTNIINPTESRGDFFSRPSIYESAIVVDFVSDPIEFLSEKIDIIDMNNENIKGNKIAGTRNNIFNNLREGKRRRQKFNQSSEENTSDMPTMSVTRLEAYTLEKSSEKVVNSDLVSVMPRNSIIAINISKGNIKASTAEVFLPFFSSHICLPVKPGEHVWCFYDNVGGKRIGYWISRKTALLPVEDVNYTHADRNDGVTEAISTVNSNKASQPEKKERLKSIFTSFQNSISSVDINSRSLKNKDYDDIIVNSKSYKDDFVGQAVPRYNKKCSDLLLQGSNNTVIAMTHNNDDKGTITIAAGRPTNPAYVVRNNRTLKAKIYEYDEEDKSQDVITVNNLQSLKNDRLNQNNINEDITLAASFIKVSETGKIEIRNQAGAAIILGTNGDIIIEPSAEGVVRLGGEGANKALVSQDATDLNGTVKSKGTILTTAGGYFGEGDMSTLSNITPQLGKFASKILVK